jgi:hypothetical protein
MKIWTVPVALLACSLGATSAHADQCAWVDGAVAARAARAITRHPSLVDFCQPCGDEAPGAPRQVTDATVRPVEGDFSEVVVDGQGIDLAYSYVRTAPDRFDNLAELAGCPATGVASSLRVDPATTTGVLIRPDDTVTPPAGTHFATPPPPLPSPSPAVAAPGPVYNVSVAPMIPGWILVLIASGATVVAGLSLVLVGLAFRRRRADLPRALALVDRHKRPRP